MERLTVSVIIPTYNRAHLIRRALDSVLSQTEPGDEIIVVDDGSCDNTEQVLKAYGDRIRYFKTENAGAGAARNRGVKEARGALVGFMDSDDEWMPNKLILQRQLMAVRPDVLFSFSGLAITTRNGGIVRNYLKYWHNDSRSWDQILNPGIAYSEIAALPENCEDFKVYTGNLYASLAKAIYVSTITVLVRRLEAGEALRFEEDLPMYEDWLCFARLARKGTAAYLDLDTAWQHSHPGPRLTDSGSLVMATTRLTILERLWGKDPEYLAEHEAEFKATVREQHLLQASSLISLGRTGEARTVLQAVTGAPFHFTLLASLPGFLARDLLRVRRALRALLWKIMRRSEPI